MILILTVYPGPVSDMEGGAFTHPPISHPILPTRYGFSIEPRGPALPFSICSPTLSPCCCCCFCYSLLVVFGNGPNSGSDISVISRFDRLHWRTDVLLFFFLRPPHPPSLSPFPPVASPQPLRLMSFRETMQEIETDAAS
ncbi:hypothetical protein CEXT_548021 [Caerostris extrusa]|uniref:Uncharacterized protein n=1 Tax=Caerostris extrusa TaxID=172846 RepID=A0AAV4NZ16_CAEEX|nr:hypothetical protein CEXT_548021 [Caerostris extrusa]